MFLTYLMFAVALCLSAVAAFYSIVGLAAIFAAAVMPIVLMGSILEIAKLTVTVWLHEYWTQVKWTMKAYLVPAVGILMVITSMGIFGFLSKAHLDQAVPTRDVAAQVTLIDEKIRTQRDNAETARRALAQMDAQVDQLLSRSADEQGAQRAANLRRQQGAERTRLQREIGQAQAEIARLNEQRAPIAADLRKVEAEVGPIKYIAALIYGDNPDANLLEKAVRWVIIILVTVFDPLAIFMLLAATESLKWERAKRQGIVVTESPDQPVNDSVKKLRDRAFSLWSRWRNQNADNAVVSTTAPYMDGQSPRDDLEHQPVVTMVEQPSGAAETKPEIKYEIVGEADEDPIESYVAKSVMKEKTAIDTITPVKERDPRITMGTTWPPYSHKGDLFIKTSTLPTTLYKFNNEIWVPIDKKHNDLYYYYDEYINFLVEKISSGEYDSELLTEEERHEIELKLKKEI